MYTVDGINCYRPGHNNVCSGFILELSSFPLHGGDGGGRGDVHKLRSWGSFMGMGWWGRYWKELVKGSCGEVH